MLTIYKITEILITIVFAATISDFRRKKGMQPLVDKRSIAVLKCCYPLPIGIYFYIVSTVKTLSFVDGIGLAVTLLATILAIKAKADLKKHHTWTGYRLEEPGICKSGIYSLMRHPIYTSIYLFIFGAISTIAIHGAWYLTVIVIVSCTYILGFLGLAASRESVFLEKALGEPFVRYKSETHAFLPMRRSGKERDYGGGNLSLHRLCADGLNIMIGGNRGFENNVYQGRFYENSHMHYCSLSFHSMSCTAGGPLQRVLH